ncbi:MAG: ABC transporter ATP-binding protein [Candidatus Aureabacteria bacterium]|nr:ABC transporter ATP-binding protein [Candidatus Auribacterota bacterium]
MDLIIEADQLCMAFGSTQALSSVSLQVEKGEMFGLIGPDGAGKTTLIRILTTLITPDSGEAKVLGYSVHKQSAYIRQRIGYMPQRFSLYPDLTVEENLRFFSDLFQVSREERESRTEELMAFSRLSPFMKRRADRLSGGMKQKLALCCALIHTPHLLILDEPTTGVDPVSRREFWEILQDLKGKGVTIFVSTPYMDEASRCNRIALIHQGTILAVQKLEAIKKLFQKTVYAVFSPDLTGLSNHFKKDLRPEFVQILGDKVKVILNKEDGPRMENLVASAADQGHTVHHVEQLNPELEDVFVTLMNERDSHER